VAPIDWESLAWEAGEAPWSLVSGAPHAGGSSGGSPYELFCLLVGWRAVDDILTTAVGESRHAVAARALTQFVHGPSVVERLTTDLADAEGTTRSAIARPPAQRTPVAGLIRSDDTVDWEALELRCGPASAGPSGRRLAEAVLGDDVNASMALAVFELVAGGTRSSSCSA